MSMEPIYLLADSQLLFWTDPDRRGSRLLESIARTRVTSSPLAVYIGASNGDAPEFYEIFEAAMDASGIANCRMIQSVFSAEDEANLSRADIILLAGGDVERGWKVICATGMRDLIVQRYAAGAVLVGVSAGAVQLGLDGFQLCPFVVGAHDEKRDWCDLADTVRRLQGRARGIGIPAGGGVIAHADGTIEAVRAPAHELVWNGNDVVSALLLPDAKRDVDEQPTTRLNKGDADAERIP